MRGQHRVVQTDNFGRDYPNERFVEGIPFMNKDQAEQLAQLLNSFVPTNHNRYWKVVNHDYELSPGFEP